MKSQIKVSFKTPEPTEVTLRDVLPGTYFVKPGWNQLHLFVGRTAHRLLSGAIVGCARVVFLEGQKPTLLALNTKIIVMDVEITAKPRP